MSIALIVLSVIVNNTPNLVGFILPPFVELLNKDVQNDNQKQVISVLVCFLVAVVLDWNQIANGNTLDAATYAGLIYMESNTLFKLYFKNSLLRTAIQNKLNGEGNTGETALETEGATQ